MFNKKLWFIFKIFQLYIDEEKFTISDKETLFAIESRF